MTRFLRFLVVALICACSYVPPPPVSFPTSGAYLRERGSSRMGAFGYTGVGLLSAGYTGFGAGYERQINDRMTLGVSGIIGGNGSIIGAEFQGFDATKMGGGYVQYGLHPKTKRWGIAKSIRLNFGVGGGYLEHGYYYGTVDFSPQWTLESQYGQISFLPVVGLSHAVDTPGSLRDCDCSAGSLASPLFYTGPKFAFSVRPVPQAALSAYIDTMYGIGDGDAVIFITMGLGVTFEFPIPKSEGL